MLKIIPLYSTIIVGYIAGKTLKTDRDVISSFLFYIIAPIVILNGILNIGNDYRLLLLPLIVYIISCAMCFIVQRFSSIFLSDSIRNIIAFGSGSSSTGQVGLPIVIVLFDPETVGIYILAFTGVILFENTYGFYVAAKRNFSAYYCFKRLFTLPSLYAIIIGCLMNVSALKFPSEFQLFFQNMRSTYIVLGTSTIGLSLAALSRLEFDWSCITLTLVVKYLFWPIAIIGVLWIDNHYLHFYDVKTHNALIMLSVVPMSSTTMVIASVLNYPSEKLSVVILLNIIVGIFYIPAIVAFLL